MSVPTSSPSFAALAPPAPPSPRQGGRRYRRALLWVTLVALLMVAQSLLVWMSVNYESTRAQEQVDQVSVAVAASVKQTLNRNLQNFQALLWNDPAPAQWRLDAASMLRNRPEVLRVELRDAQLRVVNAVDTPFQTPMFSQLRRDQLDLEAELTCAAVERLGSPAYSRSYFVPLAEGLGAEVMDVCLPVMKSGQLQGFMTATFSLSSLLGEVADIEQLRSHELSFVDGDGTRLARVGLARGAGVYVSERLVDLPGLSLQLKVDSSSGSPQFIPNLTVGLVLGLSMALSAVVLLLVRDVRRRAVAEGALAEALAFRKAMEDSLVTGLRARDLQGRVTYVNPAFCRMVGFRADEMIGRTTPPYWPPDLIEEYSRRQVVRLASQQALDSIREPSRESREGFETVFMRKSGERISVLIFEAPLVDGSGHHTGWMSAVLDVSDQRRMEELSRQQQERLAATARLATVGEMASLLSHELNQPLAAIASYAAGSLNLMHDEVRDPQAWSLLQQATERIAEQAERAGRVIKSVHDFVRRREQAHEPGRVQVLIEAVLPLVRLQARKSGTRVELDVPDGLPRVVCDRTMVEQVLLNLTRNGIQAMDGPTPPEQRELLIRVRHPHARWVSFHVLDRGPGISADVAQRLFTPFFTTRSEGMGLGLSLCRTVIEQHGGALDFEARPVNEQGLGGTEFRFTLPAEVLQRPAPGGRNPAIRSSASTENLS